MLFGYFIKTTFIIKSFYRTHRLWKLIEPNNFKPTQLIKNTYNTYQYCKNWNKIGTWRHCSYKNLILCLKTSQWWNTCHRQKNNWQCKSKKRLGRTQTHQFRNWQDFLTKYWIKTQKQSPNYQRAWYINKSLKNYWLYTRKASATETNQNLTYMSNCRISQKTLKTSLLVSTQRTYSQRTYGYKKHKR